MVYTIKKLAQLAGVSVRTLHYYDEIGLLRPSYVKENGYRHYEEKELLKLQQILFFRELEFPLEEIVRIMHSPNYDTLAALSEQKKLLLMKKNRIEALVNTIDKTVITLKGGEPMKNDDLFASFTDEQIEQHKEEAKKRWGHTDAYKQSIERTKHWTKEDYRRIAKEGRQFTKKLAEAMEKGIQSPEVQSMIDQHYKSIGQFYDCPLEMYRNLGEMYVADPRFTAYYDSIKPGLAVQVRDAIAYYCTIQTKK